MRAIPLLLLLAVTGCEQRQSAPAPPPPPPADEAHKPAQPPPPLEQLPAVKLSRGQQLYVPCYSSIYTQDQKFPIQLTVTVSVHNTSTDQPIDLHRMDYYDSKGRRIQAVVERPVRLGPLQTRDFVVEEKDRRGGTAANFIVQWSSEKPVTPPVVESVNLSMGGSTAFAFSSPARVLRERRE